MKRFFAYTLLLFVLPAALPAHAPAQPPHSAAPPPATPAQPIPDIPTLLHQVEIARQHNGLVMENYLFDATTTTRDAKGRTDVKVAEISYINGVRIERQLSHNGTPLPPLDADKETERTDKAIAKAKERKARAEAKGEVTDSNGDTLISLDRLLQLFNLTNARREMLNGRSSIVFDFTGNRSVKTKSIAEAVIQTFTGTVWIDEKDHQIAKISGSTPGGYRMGLGLIINIAKGTGGTVEFTPVNGEVWLPARLDGQGHARFLLVDDALDGAESTVFSNFHKYQVSVDQTVTAPDAPKH